MSRPHWAPADIDLERANAARIYDYFLGGSHNFAVDRGVGDLVVAAMPDVRSQAAANRAFLSRAVAWCVRAGVHQFLDIGSGIPTQDNVHEVAQRLTADARVAYVDVDPVVVAHSRAILAGDLRTVAIQQDLRHPAEILANPDVRATLDLRRPVAVLLVAILHAVPDEDDPAGVVAALRDALPAGSHLVVAHGTDEGDPARAAQLQALSARTNTPLHLRSRRQVERLFDGFDLVPPGVVWVAQWPSDVSGPPAEAPESSNNYAGVGRKP
jgi:hypothetical protein